MAGTKHAGGQLTITDIMSKVPRLDENEVGENVVCTDSVYIY